jgi:hypothetical protein
MQRAMSDTNFEIRSKLGNYFRGYTHYIDEKANSSLELNVYMVINGMNQRIDWTFDLGEPAEGQLEEFFKTLRLDIAAMWMLDSKGQMEYITATGRFADAQAMTLTLTDEDGITLASITDGEEDIAENEA